MPKDNKEIQVFTEFPEDLPPRLETDFKRETETVPMVTASNNAEFENLAEPSEKDIESDKSLGTFESATGSGGDQSGYGAY